VTTSRPPVRPVKAHAMSRSPPPPPTKFGPAGIQAKTADAKAPRTVPPPPPPRLVAAAVQRQAQAGAPLPVQSSDQARRIGGPPSVSWPAAAVRAKDPAGYLGTAAPKPPPTQFGPSLAQSKTPSSSPPRSHSYLVQCQSNLPQQLPTVQAARPATVQRKISHDGTTYLGDANRPGWRALLKRHVIDDYNTRTGKSLAYNVDLTDEDLDRCHRVSFSDIEGLILNYLNGNVNDSDFIRLTDTVKAGTDYTAFGKARMFLMAGKSSASAPSQLLSSANSLLSMLNSATFNVALGNARTNRGIQEKLDLHFTYTGSAYSLTPNSRAIATDWVGHTSGVPLTPTGTNIRSSFAPGGTVPLGNLTPNSTTLIGLL
jgi:hypothetical protein